MAGTCRSLRLLVVVLLGLIEHVRVAVLRVSPGVAAWLVVVAARILVDIVQVRIDVHVVVVALAWLASGLLRCLLALLLLLPLQRLLVEELLKAHQVLALTKK